LDGPRTAVVSCATVAVDTTQAARASRTGTATPGEALVLMTTVKGGATVPLPCDRNAEFTAPVT